MNRLLIGIDIGNSSIRTGYFTGRGLLVQTLPAHPLRASLEYAEEISSFLQQKHIEKRSVSCIICSVVPTHTGILAEAVRLATGLNSGPLIVNSALNTGLALKIDAPDNLGPDRLANAAGAYGIYSRAVAVADFGTATTITLVDASAGLIGGAIMPGLGLMTSVLGTGTSQLDRVAVEPPASALGKDTKACIQSGLFYGTAGAVERIISEAENETGLCFLRVITGGNGPAMQRYMTRPCESRPDLIFEGLRIIYDKNRP